jgi:hypothetical protein
LNYIYRHLGEIAATGGGCCKPDRSRKCSSHHYVVSCLESFKGSPAAFRRQQSKYFLQLLPSLFRILALIGLDTDHVMGSVGSDRSSFLADRAALALAPSLSYWSGFQKAIEGGLWYAKPANRVLQQDNAAASVPWHCSRPAHTALILMSIAHPYIFLVFIGATGRLTIQRAISPWW